MDGSDDSDFIDGDGIILEALRQAVPACTSRSRCPDRGCSTTYVYDEDEAVADIIIHLNDDHEWTREQIADWLETLDLDLRFMR